MNYLHRPSGPRIETARRLVEEDHGWFAWSSISPIFWRIPFDRGVGVVDHSGSSFGISLRKVPYDSCSRPESSS